MVVDSEALNIAEITRGSTPGGPEKGPFSSTDNKSAKEKSTSSSYLTRVPLAR